MIFSICHNFLKYFNRLYSNVGTMSDLTEWIPAEDLAFISTDEQHWLKVVFERFGGYPSLEQIWSLMDEQWHKLNCNSMAMDSRINAYYSHPVWLLNGLFIDQHSESIDNRRRFTNWVVNQSPRRVADFGGGFGNLAGMIAEACPNAEVEIIEPHPHPLAIGRTARKKNVRYRPELTEDYDILIATDVFEHVPDPLALVAKTAMALRPGSLYLIANYFAPVILCHLPQNFHFRYSWDTALAAMGLDPREKVAHGRVFVRQQMLDICAAREIEQRSKRLWSVTSRLPGCIARPITQMYFNHF